MDTVSEALFEAWLRIAPYVSNLHLGSNFTKNETRICYALYRQQKIDPTVQLTPTAIADITKIRKSQVNRNLNQLERKNIVRRERSVHDRRQVFVHFNLEHADVFQNAYTKAFGILDKLVEEIGIDDAQKLTDLLNRVSMFVEEEQLQEDGAGADSFL
ncbi:MAG: MarR family winged helix-turn-helix transcriptional regulator [Atopobiaceae bacterium]|jgi:DNA-binding MarR family transcriptional regulator